MGYAPRWAPVAVTTCAARVRDGFAARQVAEVRRCGWGDVRLFADGLTHAEAADLERGVGVPVTAFHPALRTHGNFSTALLHTYVRDPQAERFLVAQDDWTGYAGLKAYLDRAWKPDRSYLNGYTFRENCAIVAKGTGCPVLVPRAEGGGWCEGEYRTGFFRASGKGRGAVFLLFDREAVVALVGSAHMAERPQDLHRGHKAVDGGVVTALAKAGVEEWCHWPSLVQHVGDISSMGNAQHRKAESYRGADFDALEFLREGGG